MLWCMCVHFNETAWLVNTLTQKRMAGEAYCTVNIFKLVEVKGD